MAARTTDAAASLSPDRAVFSCFLSCKSQCFCTYSSRLTVLKRAYSREFLLDVDRTTFFELNSFVYLYSLYVHMVKLYLSVFECLLSVFNVNCMHQGSESNTISILCMYVLYMWKN